MGNKRELPTLCLKSGGLFVDASSLSPTFGYLAQKRNVQNMTIRNKQKPNTYDHQDCQKKRIEQTNQIFGVSSYLVSLLSGMGVIHNR